MYGWMSADVSVFDFAMGRWVHECRGRRRDVPTANRRVVRVRGVALACSVFEAVGCGVCQGAMPCVLHIPPWGAGEAASVLSLPPWERGGWTKTKRTKKRICPARFAASAMSSGGTRLNVFPTRQNLQVMKIKLVGAKKGHSLLKKKADALTMRLRGELRTASVTRAPSAGCLL